MNPDQNIISTLTSRARHLLLERRDTDAVADIKALITEYRDLELHEMADTLELVFNQFVLEWVVDLKNEVAAWETPSVGQRIPHRTPYEVAEERSHLQFKPEKLREILKKR